jgi:Dyp-type peroxidase family
LVTAFFRRQNLNSKPKEQTMVASASSTTSSPALPLKEIQGNLLGFFKPFQRFVFLRFRDKQSAQGFIGVVMREIDTCGHVLGFRGRFKWNRSRGRPLPKSRWFNLLLSARGLDLLEAAERELFEQAFRDGMRPRAQILGDVEPSSPEQWVPPFQEEIHAMAILAADTAEDLELLHKQLRRHTNARSHPVDELGQVDGRAREGDHHGHEHFGFVDGISQPGIQGLPGEPIPGQEMVAAGEFVFGYPRQDEQPPPPPPPGYQPPAPAPNFPSWAKDGSLVVFRRLRQNVKGFNDFVSQTSQSTALRPDLLEAKLVGRYRSGAPLERTKDEPEDFEPQAADPSVADSSILDDKRLNNFEYEPHDADGHLVPRAAHIRKAYPRNQNPPGKPEAERRRILRRGITYGPDFQESESPYPGAGSPPAEQDRGLVFVCYQSSIERQFEFIQTQWANREDFPQAGDGRDPIISQDVADPKFSIPPDHLHLVLQRWVITTGGEYLFSPSISALRMLAESGTD